MKYLLKLIIIADDLTGSNDAGLQFAKQGFSTISLLDTDTDNLSYDADVWVFNAETRSLDVHMAYERTKQLAGKLDLNQVEFVYKKIDSTMRGNIGAEIDALMDEGAFELAVVVPAYPKNNRMTVGGYHLVSHVLLGDSEIARDPKCPVTESHIPTLLGKQSKRTVGHVELITIRSSEQVLQESVKNLMSEKKIIVFDSFSQEDLKAVTKSILKLGYKTLWVGSAGLADSLSDAIRREKGDRSVSIPSEVDNFFPVLIVAGSVNAVTRQQIHALRERDEFQVVTVDPVSLLEQFESNVKKITEDLANVMDSGKSPILTTLVSESARRSVEKWMEESGTDSLQTGNLIAEALGTIAAKIVTRRNLCGMVLTGGDIAYQTCKSLNVKALSIDGEVEEGIPLATIIGGSVDHLPIVTKAGAFGNRDSLVKAVEKIKKVFREV